MQQFWLNSEDLKKQSNQPWPSFATEKEKELKKRVVEERDYSMEAPFDYLSTQERRPRQLKQV